MELIAFILVLILLLTIMDVALSFIAFILGKLGLPSIESLRELSLFKMISSLVFIILSWVAYSFGGRRVKETVLILSFIICVFLIIMVWLDVMTVYFS